MSISFHTFPVKRYSQILDVAPPHIVEACRKIVCIFVRERADVKLPSTEQRSGESKVSHGRAAMRSTGTKQAKHDYVITETEI